MGTNYYADMNRCAHCGRADRLHIGKSSAGWCFSLRVYPERDINSLDDWRHVLISNPIRDESGRTITPEQMFREITNRRGPEWTDEELARNHAIRGPHGLARHADAEPGEGTWDYVNHDFS